MWTLHCVAVPFFYLLPFFYGCTPSWEKHMVRNCDMV